VHLRGASDGPIGDNLSTDVDWLNFLIVKHIVVISKGIQKIKN